MKNSSTSKSKQSKVTYVLVMTTMLFISSIVTINTSNTAIANPINRQNTTIKKTKIQPTPIPQAELPAPLEKGILFRETSAGGITGAVYKKKG
ncbi:MAG: hypothetical protein EAZ76_17190 [Nostocales cyanobacterium]|nr:MAG: hypothetical protein EAZ87_24800 [Nostocales cyanobacterium]TAF08054.1 MAG: hypothetical protein EAZ76_17190 [Nostocales cyanobacterium]